MRITARSAYSEEKYTDCESKRGRAPEKMERKIGKGQQKRYWKAERYRVGEMQEAKGKDCCAEGDR